MSTEHHGLLPVAELNTEDTIRRLPRIVGHLIAESLGYFTPEGAANALLHFKLSQEFWFEWFIHMAGVGRKLMLQVAADTIRRTIRQRRFHRGYMSSYELALKIVRRRIATGRGPVFASWF
jgi:hypothetical protein